MEFPLWEHQKQGIKRGIEQTDFAFFFQVGTGKSRTAIEVLRSHYNTHRRIMMTFIFCPVIIVDNWKREILKFSKTPESYIHCLSGSIKDRIKILNEKKAGIYITNYDALTSNDFARAVLSLHPEILILDEAHRCKNIQAKRTKQLIQISKDMQLRKQNGKPIYRYLLTGTPILNSQIDIFSQFLILDGGETFGSNFYAFRASYFYDKNAAMPKSRYFPNWVPIPTKQDELSLKIGNKSMNAQKKDCLDLPPLIKQNIYVEMGKEQKRVYDEMKKDFITYLNDSACVANLAITKALRLQQVLSGYIPLEDGTVYEFKENPRLDALKELLSDIAPHHKIIVWSVFRHSYAQIAKVCEELKLKYVEVTGDTPTKEKIKNVDAFNNDHDVRVYISNPQASGLGITLTASSYSIYYSRNFSLENDIQSEARNYRAGSERHDKVTRINIICPNSLDSLISESLEEKQNLADKILRLKEML